MAVIPFVIILIMLYGHYLIDIALAAGKGMAERTVLQFAGFSPQILFFFLSQIALCTFLVMYGGIWIAAPVISLILPASIAAMAVERNFVQALNPIVLMSYMKMYRPITLIPMLGIWVILAAILWLPIELWQVIRLFIYFSMILWLFFVIGTLLIPDIIRRHDDLSETNARVYVEDIAPPEVSFERLTDEWHRFNEVREMSKALQSIQRYIQSQSDQAIAAEQVMVELSSWRNSRLAYRFLPDYLGHVAATKKYGLMYKYYRKLCLEHGAIAVPDNEVRDNLYQFALSMDDDDLTQALQPKL